MFRISWFMQGPRYRTHEEHATARTPLELVSALAWAAWHYADLASYADNPFTSAGVDVMVDVELDGEPIDVCISEDYVELG